MADGKELKPKSFRIDDETADKFKEVSAKIGGNQQETLAKLIEAFEFQSGKAILTDKKADIEQFEKYVSILTRMYMTSLEDNQNLTETIRTEFDAQLKSKDAVIQDLQEKVTVANQLKEEYSLKAKAHASENEDLKNAIERLNTEYNSKMDDMQSMLEEKEKTNKLLIDTCTELKSKVAGMEKDVEQLAAVQARYNQLNQDYNNTQMECQKLESVIERNKEHYEDAMSRLKKDNIDELARAELEHNKALLDAEKKYQEQIEQLKAEKQAEVDKYQQKYFELLESLK